MRDYIAKSSGNALVVVLVVVLVLALGGGGIYLYLANREKGAMVVKGDDNSTDEDSDVDDEEETPEEPTDEENPDDEEEVDENGNPVVTYDGSKFSPSSVKVVVGGQVTFKNESNRSMWPAVDPHPIHTDLPGFDAGESIGAGESVTFTFSKTGEWDYHNHLNSGQKGTIVVTEE